MSGEWTVTNYGTVHIHGHRTGESGRTIDVQHTFDIVPTTVNGIEEARDHHCALFSRPWTAFNAQGQVVQTAADIPVNSPLSHHHGLPSGLLVIRMAGCPTRTIMVH